MYYITNGVGSLSVGVDTVILVSPTNSTFHDQGYIDGGDSQNVNDTRGIFFTDPGLTLTISGNYKDKDIDFYYDVIDYYADNVNSRNAAIRFNGTGTINFSAQTGAYDAKTNSFTNSNILIYAESVSATDDQNPGKKGGNKIVDIACFEATDLTISGDMSASLTSYSNMHNNDYKDNNNADVSTGSGNSAVTTAFRVDNFTIANNYSGSILAEDDFVIFAKATPTVSGNTVSTIGILASQKVTVAGNLDGTIESHIDGIPYNDNGTPDDESDDTPAVYNGMQASADPTKTGISAVINGNSVNAIAIKSDSLNVTHDFNATWTSSINLLAFLASSNDKTAVSFTNNTLEVSGYNGSTFEVNGQLNGSITAIANDIYIGLAGYATPSTNNRHHVISGNDFTVSGINLTGNLTAHNNINTDITVQADNNQLVLNGPATPSSDYLYTNNYHLYGINAKNININGHVGKDSNISVTSSMSSVNGVGASDILYTFATFSYGIYAQNFTADNYAGTISVTSGEYSCGIYVRDTLKGNSGTDEPFNFNGSITVRSNVYSGVASGIMGLNNGYNLRVSGTIDSSYEAITSGTWGIGAHGGNTYTYAIIDDYVELAAGAIIKGDIQLDAGTNTFVVDSQAQVAGALRSNGGLTNVQFNLNGIALATPTITTNRNTSEDAFAVSTTKITINLNDAQAGERYYLANDINIVEDVEGKASWSKREFTLAFQGDTQKVAYGQTFDFATLDGHYNVQAVISSNANGLYIDVLQKDSYNVLDTVAATATAPTANSVTVSWNPASGADTSYVVEYADNINFKNSVAKNTSGLSVTLNNLDKDQKIYYRVRAVNQHGQSGNWSSVNSIDPGKVVVEAPTAPSSMLFINPDKPTEGINTAAVKFDWSDSTSNSSGIKYYSLEYVISSKPLTADQIDWGQAYQRQTNASEFLLTGLPEQSLVYWRVSATSNDGMTSDYTYGNEFKSWTADKTAPIIDSGFTIKANPTYVTDDNGSKNETLVFNWGGITDKQSGISSYIIVCTGSDGYTKTFTVRETDPLHPVINSLSIKDINSNLPDSLRSGNYTFTFQAIDWVGNRTGLIQGNNTFTVSPTVTPNAVVKSADDGTTSATFTWQMPGDVTGYSFEYMLGDTADFSNVSPINFTVNDPSFGSSPYPTYTINNLDETSGNTSYFWRIQASYADGSKSSWINGNSFYFDNTPPDSVTGTYAVVDIKYNTSSSTNNWGTTTTSSVKTSVNAYLYWNAVTDNRSTVTYKVEVADNEYFNNAKSFTTNNDYLNFGDGTNGTIGAGVLSGMKNVYWRVYASDQNGNTSAPTNGTFYYVINPYVSDVIVSQSFKWGDVDTIAPTKVTIASQVYSGTTQYFNWSTSTSLEGVAGYNITFTDKQGNVMYQDYTTNTSITITASTGVADGNYKMSVQAVGTSGKTSAAATKSVYIDFNGPTAVVSPTAAVFNSDVNLTWGKPYDLFGIVAYQIRYTSKTNSNISVSTFTTSNKLSLTGLANGNYTYDIRGIDNNGNYGVWTSNDFTVDTVKTAGKTYTTGKDMTWGESSDQSFGGSWPANYFKYEVINQDGLFTFNIDNMAYGNAKISVYSVVGANTLQLIKTYSITQGKDYSFLFNLKVGKYCVMMGSASNYNYGSYTINSSAQYGISNWTYNAQSITGSVSDGVLGYGTPTNTFSFNMLNNGEINLSVNNVVGGTVSLTIYQTVNGVDKKLKTLSVSPKNVSGVLKGLDLYAGDYKIVLANSQASQNVTAEYDLSIDGSYFPADTESLVMVDQPDGTVKGTVTDAFVGFGDPSDSFTFTATNQAEYNFALSDLSANATLTIYQTINGKQVKLTTVNAGDGKDGYFDTLLNSGAYMIVVNNPNPTKANTTFDLTVQSENNLINYTQPGDGNANGWLNAANSADYYDFTMYSTGKVTLSLDNVTASTKLSIIDSNNKVVATISTSSLISKDFNLAAGDYWLKVESTKTTAYDFNVLVA